MSVILGVLRSFGLRCPNCHEGHVMKNWFVVNPACPKCGLTFLKDSGDFWGGMVFSYTYAGFVAMVIVGIMVATNLGDWSTRVYTGVICGAASIFLLHPITRANWVAVLFLTRGQEEEYRPPAPRA